MVHPKTKLIQKHDQTILFLIIYSNHTGLEVPLLNPLFQKNCNSLKII